MATLDVQVSIDAPAVDRAMVASGDRCEQLARALELRDTTAIESTAEHAVNVWLAGERRTGDFLCGTPPVQCS